MENPSANVNLNIYSSKDNLAKTAAAEFIQDVSSALVERDVCMIAIAGGSLPSTLMEGLSQIDKSIRSKVKWNQCHFFLVDERIVPKDDKESNYRLCHEMLDTLGMNAKLHSIAYTHTWTPTVAQLYSFELRDTFASCYTIDPVTYLDVLPIPVSWPRFDVILLGMGEDGHVASLFPGHTLVQDFPTHLPPNIDKDKPFTKLLVSDRNTVVDDVEWEAECVAGVAADNMKAGKHKRRNSDIALSARTSPIFAIVDSPKEPQCRITFSMMLINRARKVIFIVSGENKKNAFMETLTQVLETKKNDEEELDAREFHCVVDNAKKFTINSTQKLKVEVKDNGVPLPASLVYPRFGHVSWHVGKEVASELL